MPRAAVGEPMCRLGASLWYAGAPAAREAVRDNLRHVLGREPRPGEVREVFFNGALNYWDVLLIPSLSKPRLFELVRLHGKEHIDAARAAGRGVILAGAHLSSVSLVGQMVPALGYPTLSILEPIQPPRLYDFFTRRREALGGRMLPATSFVVREMLAALKRNEVVGVVSDRDLRGTGVLVRFFDAPARFPDGLAALALRSGAPMLPSVAVRRADGTFEAIIEPPLPVPSTGNPKQDALALTQALAGRLEYHIAKHPEQWTVFQRRWSEGFARE
ncbi:MAG: lysophospholipid acyltransferase family protein [Chloroflexota bacterium]|nr:lysophospholipid acyltransferase family protein [Chloroflexota bacterium]